MDDVFQSGQLGHTRMEESEKSPPLSKGVMHKVQTTKFMRWTSNIVAIQVTETRALIEKHYYRIDVIEKVLAKKAMEEEER